MGRDGGTKGRETERGREGERNPGPNKAMRARAGTGPPLL